MECSKKEAIRAKRIAENKMENKDFLRARKIAIHAQKLYPELENISQLIMVCDVHCSAENKVHGTEMDWYGILKVEPTADDLLIRKQSRKFGLFLHPDKNKFPGAADAFKLIGEAQSVLLDQEKRWIYDMKCISAAAVNDDPNQANRPSNVQRPPGHEKNSVNAKDVLNKSIKCQTCRRSFIDNVISIPGVASHNSWSLLPVSKQTGVHHQAPSKVDQQSNADNFTKLKVGENIWSPEAPQGSEPNKRCGYVSTNCNQKRKAEMPQLCEKMNKKERKQVFEFSKCCNSKSSTKSKEVFVKGGGSNSKPSPPRSSRSKRDVSFKDNINDDINVEEPAEGNNCQDSSQSTKVAVKDLPPEQVPPVMDCNKEEALRAKGIAEKKMENKGLQNTRYETKIESENKNPSEVAESGPKIFEYPGPDFSYFDKMREEKCFAAGQIWAVYDTQDTMPRFYAQIVKVLHPKFKLRITWLEPYSDDKDETIWAEENLPVSCGNFRLGCSENTEDHLMFSHLVNWEKGSRLDTYKIYPRKGETWALFKSWDINWSSDPENHRRFEYEFVEVLSDYTNRNSIFVAYLGKVKGDVCLFCQTKQEGVGIFEIKPTEIFRFSHRIPSFRMTGKERKGIPVESFKLDPACLPINLIDEHKMLQSNAIDSTFENPNEDAGVAQDIPEEAYKIHNQAPCKVGPQASRPSSVQKLPRHESSSLNANRQFQQAPQTVQTGFNRLTFWTACPSCFMRYQFYREVLYRNLCCQNCRKAFTAYEVNGQVVAPQNNSSQSAFLRQTGVHNQAPCKVGRQSNAEFSTRKVEIGGNTWSSETAQESEPNEKSGDVSMNFNQKRKAEIPQPCGKMNEKKAKQFFECSKGVNSEAGTKSKEELPIEGGGLYCEPSPRRSSRSRNSVSCTGENAEDLLPKQEPPGMNGSTGLDAHMEENDEEAIMKKHRFPEEVLPSKGSETEKSENGESSEQAKTKPEIFEYPYPDFSDFDKNREEKSFVAGQIWAVYDTQDTMPRFYAQILKVLHPKFKLQITWLEPDPDDKDEIKWAGEDLPISCGNFRQGSSEYTKDHLMFSHVVSWDNGSRRNTYKIYPRKGETWALFKSWDINWSSDPENHRQCEYEFVEVLSDYANGTAISVAYLGKVKGYVCLFCRTKQGGVDIFQVEPKELFRFSHRIPSYQMTGKDVIDTLKGSFELDPLCLPPNLQEIDPPTSEEMQSRKMHPLGDFCVDLSTDEEDQKLQSDASFNMFENTTENASVVSDLSEVAYEIPNPEFYNFDANKSLEKFEIGQVWALYCDEDGMPKYYGRIKKIDRLPEYKLHVAWLGVCSTSNGMIQGIDKKIPVTCGRFQLRRMKPSEYTSTSPFSHQVSVRVESRGKKEEYVILPRKGEIWALYKRWNDGLKCSDLENCDYDIVEVIDESQSGISVLSLEEVKGFKSVFRTQVKEQFPVTFMIPANELLRFSHQIPAFRLTEERGGSLRGYLELDPAAFPFHWFCKD